MPLYKYVANRVAHARREPAPRLEARPSTTPATAPSRARLLETLPLEENSDDFVFDNQMLAQALWFGFDIGELTCPTRYFAEASSINFRRSVKYGFGVLGTALEFRLARWGSPARARLSKEGRRLALPGPAARDAAPRRARSRGDRGAGRGGTR